jgi:hypothetical protein
MAFSPARIFVITPELTIPVASFQSLSDIGAAYRGSAIFKEEANWCGLPRLGHFQRKG